MLSQDFYLLDEIVKEIDIHICDDIEFEIKASGGI
jgi:hypothetical protein